MRIVLSSLVYIKVWIFLCTCVVLHGQEKGDLLFDNSFLHEIRISSNVIPNEQLWDSLSFTYQMVNISIDGEFVDSVGIRFKGLTSASPHVVQKPLKLDINGYINGQTYDGLKKFNLNNNYQDNFLQKESLAYDLYRRAGLPAPRTSYAEVYVGEIFSGVYSIVEQIDKTFLKERFPSDDGSLYKGIHGGIVPPPISIEIKEGTRDDYDNFAFEVDQFNISEFVNLDAYLKLLAIDVIINDIDSYGFYRHNFYIYFETKSKLLNYITYDHNFSFFEGELPDVLYPIGTFPATKNLILDSSLKEQYELSMCELLSYLLDSSFIENKTIHNYNIIRSNSNGIVPQDPSSLIQNIDDRKEWLRDTLSVLNVDCSDLTYPFKPGDIVINEFVASNEIEQEPNGGTPDWIELYNNTDSDVLLNKHFYLSDDKDFPKKWNFKDEVTIAAHDYLIVWADKDIHQEGIHAGFKINKNGGELLMTYEDMTEIQNIEYGDQQLNKGFARVPNGTGDFIIQDFTFKSNNNKILTTKELKSQGIVIYPNPSMGKLFVDSKRSIDYIEILDVNGQIIKEVRGPSTSIYLNDIVAGILFLRITIDELTYLARVVVLG